MLEEDKKTLYLFTGFLDFVLINILLFQKLWIYKERCILNDSNQSIVFGYGKELNIVTLLLTMYLCYQLGINQHLQ